MYQWIKGTAYKMIVTLSSNYLTLNNYAASKFKDYKYCVIGIDSDQQKLAIKPISKNEIDQNIYPLEDLHKLNFGNGYVRISNKNLLLTLEEISKHSLLENRKYAASFDENENMLIIDLNQQED